MNIYVGCMDAGIIANIMISDVRDRGDDFGLDVNHGKGQKKSCHYNLHYSTKLNSRI